MKHPSTTRAAHPQSTGISGITSLGGALDDVVDKLRNGQTIPAEEPWSDLTAVEQKKFEQWLEKGGARSGAAVRRSLQKRGEIAGRVAEWREETRPQPDLWDQIESLPRQCELCSEKHSPRMGCQAYDRQTNPWKYSA